MIWRRCRSGLHGRSGPRSPGGLCSVLRGPNRFRSVLRGLSGLHSVLRGPSGFRSVLRGLSGLRSRLLGRGDLDNSRLHVFVFGLKVVRVLLVMGPGLDVGSMCSVITDAGILGVGNGLVRDGRCQRGTHDGKDEKKDVCMHCVRVALPRGLYMVLYSEVLRLVVNAEQWWVLPSLL